MIPQDHFTIVGAISGSSLDGLDLSLCSFKVNQQSSKKFIDNWSITKAATIPFSKSLLERLKRAPESSAHSITLLHAEFGKWVGHEIVTFLKNENAPDLVASHGHTIFHFPKDNTTLQIGCGAQIAAITGIETITDFRKADMAVGGSGAPFAPMADTYLFPNFDLYLNTGGISNITHHFNEQGPKAWDVGPFNQLLNYLSAREGKEYDAGGIMARSGQVIDSLLQEMIGKYQLNIDEPYGMDNQEVSDTYFGFMNPESYNTKDLLATSVAFIVYTLSKTIELIRDKYNIVKPTELLITGGGAHNNYLIDQLKSELIKQKVKVNIPSNEMVDYKEAALFALLGLFRKLHIPTSFSSVTGALEESVGGIVHAAYKQKA